MQRPENALPAVSSDDALPPVVPPSAGFVVQLFVVPMIIVTVIVMVYVMFTWLAQMGSDPKQHLDGIAKDHAGSWQHANNLVEDLRRDERLRGDEGLAIKTAQLLRSELTTAAANDNDVKLRVFLCKVLGEFNVLQALPPLLEAAATARTADEVPVRQAAVEALALLIDNLRQARPGDETEAAVEQALPALLAAADEEEPLVRTSAAYALGVAGGDEASRKLEALLAAADPALRSNAAFGLARHGNVKALPALVDLLDPDLLTRELPTEDETVHAFRQSTILKNALRASTQLAEANSNADLAPLRDAVENLLRQEVAADVHAEARELLILLDQRASLADGENQVEVAVP